VVKMIKLVDILSENTNYNPKDFGTVNTTYEWLEDAYMKKKTATLDNSKMVKKELKILKSAMSIAWKYTPLIDGNIKAEDYFK
tara:strand:+ start:202 stop:450 length:249 start_codon:yes stop_codon:yes gene_type:complete